MPHGTNLTSLIPTIIYTGKSINPKSSVAQDYSHQPIPYTVTAADESIQTYLIIVRFSDTTNGGKDTIKEVNDKKTITNFYIAELELNGLINEQNKSIN